ncbi:unnamed protein product, partial [Rotaria sp. Silwood2]
MSVWRGVRGIIHWELLPANCTITTDLYCQQLDRVAEKLKGKQDRIYFLHDNARPYVAKSTCPKLLELGCITVPHPPNSPSKIISLLPSNDHLQTICNSLSAPVDSKYSSYPTMITPTATLISSSTTSSSDHCSGQQLNSVQWTKLSCPPPPTSSSSSIATTTNNSLEPLETTYVANIVRKLLEQHNIGQCIFARHVLSLSQGTGSELLSKPQAWSKLTEKGKESYRKMWSWANSEESILALKSLSPRKVSSDEPKRSRTPSSSSTSSREHSPINQQSFISSSMFSTFPPSLLMQTTNRLKNDIYSPYNILYPQPENYRNWLMLQEIVRTNAMIKQFKSTDVDENERFGSS